MTGGQAALAIWVDIDPTHEAELEHWHSHEHVQERVGCPGWLRGSRFRSLDRDGRYLLFYEAETTAAFESDVYYERLRHPTTASRAIFPKVRDTWRTACTVEQRRGDGIAPALLAVRGDVSAYDMLVDQTPLRIDLLKGEADVGQAHTTEKGIARVAGSPDRACDPRILPVRRRGPRGARPPRAGGRGLRVASYGVEERSIKHPSVRASA